MISGIRFYTLLIYKNKAMKFFFFQYQNAAKCFPASQQYKSNLYNLGDILSYTNSILKFSNKDFPFSFFFFAKLSLISTGACMRIFIAILLCKMNIAEEKIKKSQESFLASKFLHSNDLCSKVFIIIIEMLKLHFEVA